MTNEEITIICVAAVIGLLFAGGMWYLHRIQTARPSPYSRSPSPIFDDDRVFYSPPRVRSDSEMAAVLHTLLKGTQPTVEDATSVIHHSASLHDDQASSAEAEIPDSCGYGDSSTDTACGSSD